MYPQDKDDMGLVTDYSLLFLGGWNEGQDCTRRAYRPMCILRLSVPVRNVKGITHKERMIWASDRLVSTQWIEAGNLLVPFQPQLPSVRSAIHMTIVDKAMRWNEYKEVQVYGGPEEGGWYYEEGTPTGRTHWGTKAPEANAQLGGWSYDRAYISQEGDTPEFRGEVVCHQTTWVREAHAPTAYPSEIPVYS